MALINCPECSGKVSDKSNICIHCGYPISSLQEKGVELKTINTIEPTLSKADEIALEYGLFTDKDYDDFMSTEEYLCCNKCYSSELTPMKSGFSVGKAALGALTLGVYGIVAGSIGSNNIRLYCNKCGNKLKSKDALSLTKSMQKYYKKNMK